MPTRSPTWRPWPDTLAQVTAGELQQRGLRGINGRRGVDRFEGGCDLLAVGIGHEPHRSPNQVNRARLNDRSRPGRLDRLGKPGQAVTTHDQGVGDAAVAQLGEHPGPELRALRGLHPDPEYVFHPVNVDTDPDMGRLVTHG